MFFYPIYLLINNNAKCLRNTLYLSEFLQTTLLLTIIYTLPIYIFSYIVTFSENKIPLFYTKLSNNLYFTQFKIIKIIRKTIYCTK